MRDRRAAIEALYKRGGEGQILGGSGLPAVGSGRPNRPESSFWITKRISRRVSVCVQIELFGRFSDDSPGLTLLSGLGHVLRTLDHCFDLSVHIHRHEFDIRVLPGKHAKHLIGEGLSHPLNTFEVA